MKRVFVAAIVVLCAMSARAFAQTPVRDVRREPTGTASLSGIVETDETIPRPLRRAVVQLIGDALLTGRQVITGDGGRFEFANLPAGQYTLQAYKSNYMRTTFGAKRPGGSGSSIVLAENQRLTDIAMRLPQYAVITGVIYDQNGEPAQGVSVEVMAYTMRTGLRTLSSVYGRPETTDDRGVYRAGGLAPGEYYVAAGPSSGNGQNSELRVLTSTDVDRALQSNGSGTPTGAPADVSGRPVSFVPVFFPGTPDVTAATKITLALGEDRAGVDFALQFVPSARIDGVVTGTDGRPAPGVLVAATQVTQAYSQELFRGVLGGVRTDPQGKFSYAGVPPGRYVLTARAEAAPGSAAAASGPQWAMTDVNVNGEDQSTSLMLQSGMSVSGKVVFDGKTLERPANVSALRINMPAASTTGVSIGITPANAGADGAFTLTGAVPGTYRLTATAPPAAGAWMLRSAVVNGVDSLDTPFEIQPGQSISGAVVTFTDHPTELTGTLQTPAGVPTSNYFIIVFSTDKSFWTPLTRRSVMARPSSAGKYALRNLPPGEYYVAAVTDVEFNGWFDPAFLEQLVDSSTRITLEEGARKALDLKIGGLPLLPLLAHR